jgi:hypothetical protein
LLDTAATTDIPEPISDAKPETGIELVVPECVTTLFVAAPLAYYLGADITVRKCETPRLTIPKKDITHLFSPLPAFQDEVASLVQRLFYLDCITRRKNPERNPELLEACSIDPEAIRSLTPAQRLQRYLETPADTVTEAAPDWHLSTYTAPSIGRAHCLPFLLEKLSLIYLPDGMSVDRKDLLEKTLTETAKTRGSAMSSDMIQPNGGAGRVRGWLAPGTPINAFKTTPTAYVNQQRNRGTHDRSLDLTVVLNDSEMREECNKTTETYRNAAAPMNVTVRNGLTTPQLASVFESETDFVHFIGHCEDSGLCCPDGELDIRSLSDVRTRTFFLNACGSYKQGLGLIHRGAIAGGVTHTDVLDSHATLVGTAFGRLLSHGFTIQRSLQLARQRIMMCKDYAAVGDGTYTLGPDTAEPILLRVTETDSSYDITCEVLSPTAAGASYELPLGDHVALNGTETEISVSRTELIDALESNEMPVVFGTEFYWSDDLAEALRANK